MLPAVLLFVTIPRPDVVGTLELPQTSGTRMELITMSGAAKAAGAKRGVFEVDEGAALAALAALEEAWAAGGYHAFGVDHGTWSAIGNAGQVLTGTTPDELDQKIRAHWQAMQ
jgi:hypothetical protein